MEQLEHYEHSDIIPDKHKGNLIQMEHQENWDTVSGSGLAFFESHYPFCIAYREHIAYNFP